MVRRRRSACRTARAVRQRVAVFARGAKADEAKAAGADIVRRGGKLVTEVQGGKIDFDRVHRDPGPDAAGRPSRQGAGPARLMPNPKVGTVTMDVAGAVPWRQGRLGRVSRREGRHRAGRRRQGGSFSAEKLVENIKAFADAVNKARPQGPRALHQPRRDFIDDGPGRKGRAIHADRQTPAGTLSRFAQPTEGSATSGATSASARAGQRRTSAR